ncbi:MAG: RNA polymerase sigma factor [Acidimicrobiia bacterium]
MTRRRATEHDDADLARWAQRGDEEAFASLLRRHAPVAHRAAYLITRSASDADDALQDGTVKAFYALDRFRTDRPFRPWFVAIVANEARNRARSGARREALRLRLSGPDRLPDPEEEALAAERRTKLLRHVEELPDKLREAVALRHILGLTERETADALGVRQGTVKSRVSRGLDRLRQAMEVER